jgi:hypothetical protein
VHVCPAAGGTVCPPSTIGGDTDAKRNPAARKPELLQGTGEVAPVRRALPLQRYNPYPEEFYRKYKSTYQPVVFRNTPSAIWRRSGTCCTCPRTLARHTVSRQAAIGHSPKHKPSGRGGVVRRSVLRDSRSLLNRVVCVRFQMSHFPPQTVHNGATRSNEPRENNTLLSRMIGRRGTSPPSSSSPPSTARLTPLRSETSGD